MMSGAPRDRRRDREGQGAKRAATGYGACRGQTTIDFVVGMSAFLLTIAFVFAFVPGMFGPFTDGTEAETPAADRVAEDLTTRTLGSADTPHVLDSACTREFFTPGAGDCRFSGGTTAERVGVTPWKPVNVTVRADLSGDRESDVLCWDASGSAWYERGHTDCDFQLTRGPKPSGSGGETVSAQRVALLDGTDVTVEVVMW